MHIIPSLSRRNVVLDIETVSLDPAQPEGALSALTGRVVCLGLAADDGEKILAMTISGTNEEHLLPSFWAEVRQTDLLIGHNILNFDLPFLRQRSWVQGVRPSRRIDLRRYYTEEVLDTMQTFSVWGAARYPGLNQLAQAFGCGPKAGDGTQVAEWWEAGDLGRIEEYCLEDVRLAYRIFHRLMFRPLPARFEQLRQPPVAVRHTRPGRNGLTLVPNP